MRLLLVLIIFPLFLSGQEQCFDNSAWWKDYERFMPLQPKNPVSLKVNIVVPQRSDGSGNFKEGDPEFDFVLEKIFEIVNNLWSEMKDPQDATCYDGSLFIPDTYIRFTHHATIFHQDDRFWNADNGSGCPREGNWYLNGLDSIIRANPQYAGAINVYLPVSQEAYTELRQNGKRSEPTATPPCSEMPSRKDLSRSSRICLAGTYNKFWWMKNIVPVNEDVNKNLYSWEPTVKQWFYSTIGHTLAHELGHSLSLGHGNEHHRRNKCEYSLMHQGHNKPHNYLPPTEIAKMHRALRLTNVRHMIHSDTFSSSPMIIDADATIDMSHWAFEDIIVKKGATLTVSCDLSMHPLSQIIVQEGGSLIVDGGMISGRSGSVKWKGVRSKKVKKCFLKKKKASQTESVVLKNGGRIAGYTD